jgi:hypothetical protein
MNLLENINNNTIEMSYGLNHPWFIYPHAFMSEYNNYGLYRAESVRLENFLGNFICKLESGLYTGSKLLVPIILGSTMEDSLVNSHTDFTNYFQFEQLFPNYINNYIEKIDGYKQIQIIIISPDNIFSNDEYSPLFTKYSKYKFEKINNLYYKFSTESFEINVNIFNCPMVTIEKRKEFIKKCDLVLTDCKKKKIIDCDISTYTQSESDLILINNIYKHIGKIFSYANNDLSNINIVVNSWVNFKNLYGYSENYNMFPELLKLASDYNIIATEWNYQDENFISIIRSDYHFGNISFKFSKIIYISYESYLFFDNDKISLNLENLKLHKRDLYIIDFSETFNLGIVSWIT